MAMDVIWQAHLRLVAAIVAQGVQDALKNDADALAWVESAGFAHWCEWLGLDAKRARRTIAGRRQTGQALRQGRSGPGEPFS